MTSGSPTRRARAELLRKQGLTYAQISDQLGIAKSTLSTWFHAPVTPKTREKQLTHLARIRVLARAARKANQERAYKKLREQIKQELHGAPLRHLSVQKMLLGCLYWAEGAKHRGVSGLKFVNTDPRLALFFITLLRTCFPLNEQRFRIRLHLHEYHNQRKCTLFWSKLLSVPRTQFGKVYIKQRNEVRRFRENFMGICFITYLDSTIRKEIMELIFQVQERVVRTSRGVKYLP